MLPRALLSTLLLIVLLLLSQTQGGRRHWRKVETIKECERKPKFYLCKRHREAHQECQENNICCSAFCGNICVNLLEVDRWAMPISPPDFVFQKGEPFYDTAFEENETLMRPTVSKERTE
ncbi:WAP four-disulfide core domain protein 10A [Nannospalax galili]|uniref:WAP four-disulfide core domain protein 10A n=1 Tax=Nannospalax galili TaxID=1026970 RepID=UPI00081A023D|nr:WAP four-disulfide core domain protein 10A [Nannospalax galili]